MGKIRETLERERRQDREYSTFELEFGGSIFGYVCKAAGPISMVFSFLICGIACSVVLIRNI